MVAENKREIMCLKRSVVWFYNCKYLKLNCEKKNRMKNRKGIHIELL